ncbi:DUF2169 domain-containing protein [uncultured Sphaerotilus sp.]|uniref:DUF2169 family type VI secretion system accessory protein n=1 Tax=uncultured Sphaerotilus sp. TaxID=474984 RepID=UPI0030CA3244
MELINSTRMLAGYNMGLEASGRELLVVVIKGTFVLPKLDEAVRLHDAQVPLVMADTFTGAPGLSAPVHEVDFAPRKPACDILLVGSAHAPQGRPTERTDVVLRVGPMLKRFDVVGDRVWQAGLTGIRVSDPGPFVRQPISYDVAFGGVDQASEDPADHDAYMANPVGRGFHRHLKTDWVDGRPLPNTEAIGQPVQWPTEAYAPMAFGPLGRGWSSRSQWAGTYDQHWRDEVFPFLPRDFDERYFQAAPVDQQMGHASGPLEVAMRHLTPDGLRHFVLPYFDAPVHVFPKQGEREDYNAVLDTIVFEPDHERFTMTWRVTRPLRRNLFEIGQVLVGKKGRDWWAQREQVAFPIPVVMVPMPREAAPEGQPG